MNMSVKKAARVLRNMVEMAFRTCDPCMACATHTLLGQMPLEVIIHEAGGAVMR